jgi:hypothetical protein
MVNPFSDIYNLLIKYFINKFIFKYVKKTYLNIAYDMIIMRKSKAPIHALRQQA